MDKAGKAAGELEETAAENEAANGAECQEEKEGKPTGKMREKRVIPPGGFDEEERAAPPGGGGSGGPDRNCLLQLTE